jgi:hypothetical protein
MFVDRRGVAAADWALPKRSGFWNCSEILVEHVMPDTLAGIPFVALAPHDLRMFRAPGVYALARRQGLDLTLLHVGHAEDLSAVPGGPAWTAALDAGLNEALVNLSAAERLDRMQLAAMVRRAYGLGAHEGGEAVQPTAQRLGEP